MLSLFLKGARQKLHYRDDIQAGGLRCLGEIYCSPRQRSLSIGTSLRWLPYLAHFTIIRTVRCFKNLDYYPFSLFSRQSTPFVTTLHGRLDLPEHQAVFATFPSIPVISGAKFERVWNLGSGTELDVHA